MLAKTVETGARTGDEHIPYVLFVYRASQQDSTLESPFFLLYGRDPRLPTPTALSPAMVRANVHLTEYAVDMATKMSAAWESAKKNVKKAQKRQKKCYDVKARRPKFEVGDRAFLLQPEKQTGAARKFARAYHGPYRILTVTENNAHLCRVDQPQGETIFVALERLRRCPTEIGDQFWPTGKSKKRGRPKKCEDPPLSEDVCLQWPRPLPPHTKREMLHEYQTRESTRGDCEVIRGRLEQSGGKCDSGQD